MNPFIRYYLSRIRSITEKPSLRNIGQARGFLQTFDGLPDMFSFFIWTCEVCGITPAVAVASNLENNIQNKNI